MMSEKQVKDWFTMNGKHIPIFEGESKQDAVNRSIAKDNEDKKQADIERNKKEADILNGKTDNSKKSKGLSVDWVEYDGVDENGDWKEDYISDDEYRKKQIEYADILKNAGAFGDEYIDTQTAVKNLDWKYDSQMKYDWQHNLDALPHTPAVGLARWKNGAWVKGYGDKMNAREEFDKIYGISDFIDKNPSVQLNTNNPLYRGVRSTSFDILYLNNAKDNGDLISMDGPSSWSSMKGMAEQFTQTSLVGRDNDVFVVFKDITKGQRNAIPYPLSRQAEVIASGSSRYKVLDVERNGDIYYVTVKQ